MARKYLIRKKRKLSANHSKDGKDHIISLYLAGRDSQFGGIDNWSNVKKDARLFGDRNTADRYARSLGGEVIEV